MIMENLHIVDGSLDMITDRIDSINESKALNESLKASNASLEPEQKAAILHDFINASSNVKVVNKKDGSTLIQ